MNVFSQPPAPRPNDRPVRGAFLTLFFVGAALRGVASFVTVSIEHPDEHQQFLEQAFRFVHGYGETFWEQDRGIRHLLYPALLAMPLAALEAVGITDPFLLAALLRWGVSLLALVVCARFAWEFHRRGDTVAALLMMAITAVAPDFVYPHSHPLSETASTIPLLLALGWLDRRPFLAGVMLGLAFGIRFQVGFLVGALVFVAWLDCRFRFTRPVLKLGAGLALALTGLALMDRVAFGEWFHSPIEYVRANI